MTGLPNLQKIEEMHTKNPHQTSLKIIVNLKLKELSGFCRFFYWWFFRKSFFYFHISVFLKYLIPFPQQFPRAPQTESVSPKVNTRRSKEAQTSPLATLTTCTVVAANCALWFAARAQSIIAVSCRRRRQTKPYPIGRNSCAGPLTWNRLCKVNDLEISFELFVKP